MDITYRPGALDDVRRAYDVFVETTVDLERRMGTSDENNIWMAPDFIARYWERTRPLFEHITRTAEYFALAEEAGRLVGYARTTLHDGVRELIDYYVLPGYQAKGVGRELLSRAFPSDDRARRKVVIATTDINAMARYLKAGVYPRFAVYYLFRKPEVVSVETDLELRPASASPETLEALRSIDRQILDFVRDANHEFLLNDRPAILCYRDGRLAGYAYFGEGCGPIALLDPADFPALLAYGETLAAQRGAEDFGMNLPMINKTAVGYLLRRGFRIEPFIVQFMSDEPFGRFESYIFSSPPFFL